MTFVDRPVRVRVPATSANLGPGFDALGLALGLYDEVSASVGRSGLRIEVTGEGCEQVALDESHLVVACMRRTFGLLGVEPAGLTLSCHNRIPHGRGLGSSAAAIVGGVLLARSLVTGGVDLLPEAAVLELANDIEGHPDNVAPCLLGGLVIAWTVDGAARAVRRDVDARVRPVALVPPFTASTELARGLLPSSVSHRDAAVAAGRSALLVAALTGSPEVLFDATEDRLHQRYREPAMPASIALVETLRAERLSAVVSGAGPTVLVLARDAAELDRAAAATPSGWTVLPLPLDAVGAVAS